MKKGVSLVSLVVVIIIMIILAGVIIITSTNSMSNAEINSFAIELVNIQTLVDEYHYRYENYPAKEDVVFDITLISSEELEQFSEETVTEGKITFKEIDLSAIGTTNTQFGKASTVNDVYVLSETSGKVYYLQGVEYEDKIYYTLTDELYLMTGANNNELLSSNSIKKQDVIFVPSSVNYTNKPVTVTVKLPINATVNEITATNSKSVSEAITESMYQVVQINQASEDKNGNYVITVNYTYENVQKQVAYEVSIFDNTAPILEVTTSESGNTKKLSIIATDNLSGVKVVKYAEKEIEDYTYFKNYGKVIAGSQIILHKDSAYTMYIEDNAGNHAQIISIGESIIPADWRENVTQVYNTVPIPKGFVASQATGENTKAGGLVIYEGTEAVTDTNVEQAKRSRNQYVWVPVDSDTFDTTFVRQNFGLDRKISNTIKSSFWEALPTTELSVENLQYITKETLAEVQAMYTSVKKYGGFYVARYETGIDEKRKSTTYKDSDGNMIYADTVYSVMGKIPYTYVPWGASMADDSKGAVEIARNLYAVNNLNYGAVSSLIYGVQWDTVLQWWLDTGAVESVTESVNYGNYTDSTINSSNDLNEGALVWDYSNTGDEGDYISKDNTIVQYPKESGTPWGLSTGALKSSKVNNVYDMAGNMYEWTMEGYQEYARAYRGGCLTNKGDGADTVNTGDGTRFCVAYRYPTYPDTINFRSMSFRIALYIK